MGGSTQKSLISNTDIQAGMMGRRNCSASVLEEEPLRASPCFRAIDGQEV